jgi:type IV pilus assembly protein PilC
MAKFFYIARDRMGKRITGVEESAGKDDLVSWLQAKGFIVTDIQLESERGTGSSEEQIYKRKFKTTHYRITTVDLSLFCRQLATLLGAGITILEALTVILKQASSRRLRRVIGDIRKSMEAGLSLHEAMAKNRTVFSNLWVHLVESGEASGNLSIILSRLANYLERYVQFRSKVISALIYPVILVCVGVFALIFLTVKIIPTFATLFSGFDMELPLLTQLLIRISSFIRQYLFFLFAAICAVIFFVRKYIKLPDGRRRYENLLFRLPLFGEFFRVLVIERFSSEMATLIESGVPILYALEISERSVDNLVMSEAIHRIKEQVRQGRSLSQPMAKSGIFEPMVIQMISIGEEVGDLSAMFKKINSFYQEYIDTFINRFTSMFEPLMLVFMGVVIGIMVVGMFLPIFQISKIGMR